MADIKIETKKIGRKGSESLNVRIVFKLTHKGQKRFIDSGIKVLASEFKKGKIVGTNINKDTWNKELINKYGGYVTGLSKISDNIKSMDIDLVRAKITVPASKEVNPNETGVNVLEAFKNYEEVLTKTGKLGSARNYRLTRNKLMEWWKGEFLDFSSLNYAKLCDFHEWLELGYEVIIKEEKKERKERRYYAVNTISIHERNLRSIFNREIKFDRIPISVYPFRKFEIKDNKNTEHRDLSIKQMQKIRDIDLSNESRGTQEARDLFMLSFYLVGMNLIDIWQYNFGKTEVVVLDYWRQKTDKEYKFLIPPEAGAIISKYKTEQGTLVFKERIAHYDSFKKAVRFGLMVVGEKTGIEHLTFYHARHTWGTLASNETDVSDDDIKLSYGHGAKTVTDRYTRKNQSRIDIANNKVIALLNSVIQQED